MTLLLTFFRRFLAHRRSLLLGFLCIPLAQVSDVLLTIIIGDALNRLESERSTDFILGVLGWMALFALGHSFFRFFQRWLIVVVSRRVEVELKQELFDKLTSLPFTFHNQSRSGDVVSRLTSDVENLRMFLGPGLMYTGGALFVVPVALFFLGQIHLTLTLCMILPMVLMGFAMKAFSPRLHRFSTFVQESLADITHRAQENFSGIRVVKGYSREDQQAAQFEATSVENKDNQIELGRARGLTHAAVYGANDLTFIAILGVGGLAAIDGSMEVGDLFKFLDLTFKVFWPLIALGWIAGMYPRAVASSKRVQELLDETSPISDPEDPVELDELRGELELRDVRFAYGGVENGAYALDAVSVHVPAGSTLGVVGPTGSGKSTLLNLLGRLYVGEGEILLDGVPIERLRLKTLRGALGYVPQDSFLFSAPYHENVRFGADEDLSDDEVRRLIQRAGMEEEVAELPDGIDQLIGERGVTLSGGQRQRTCIARALARRPRILILDDCLSAVDTETEKELLANLREEGVGRTVIVAAHRLSTVSDADRILVLDEHGRVEDSGIHAELLRREGWYRRTWRQQQRQEELREL